MELKRTLISDILATPDIPILDIQSREGATGYIDFIDINEVTSPLMRGVDVYNRPFFTICADIIYEGDICIPTFTTIFKRYTDNSLLWHTAGHYRKIACTDGGMNIPQFGLFRTLIQNGEIDFNDGKDNESIENMRLSNFILDSNGNILNSCNFTRPLRIEVSLRNPNEYTVTNLWEQRS